MTNTVEIKDMDQLIDAISGGGGATTLDNLTDVEITEPSAGQVLTYDDEDDVWFNGDLPTVPEELDDLSDVEITEPAADQVLTYDADSGKWVNSTPSGGSALAVAELSLASATWEETSSGSGIWQASFLKADLGISDSNDIISVMACSPTNATAKNIPRTIYPVDAFESSSPTYYRIKLKNTTAPSGVYIKVIYA